MRRRDFITLLGGVAAAWPLAVGVDFDRSSERQVWAGAVAKEIRERGASPHQGEHTAQNWPALYQRQP